MTEPRTVIRLYCGKWEVRSAVGFWKDAADASDADVAALPTPEERAQAVRLRHVERERRKERPQAGLDGEARRD